MNKKLGFTSLLLASASFGSFGIWIRLLSHELTTYQQIVFRNLIALVLAGLIILIGKRFLLDWKKVPKLNLLGYALAVPISVVFYNLGFLAGLKMAVATFAFYIGSIFFSELIGIIVYKDKITSIKVASLLLVIIGLFCFAWPFSKDSLSLGFIAMLVAGLFDAVSNGFRKDLAGKMDKFILVSTTAVGGIIVSGVLSLFSHQSLSFMSNLSTTTWVVGILFGFILMAVNYLLLFGFQHFELGHGVIVLSAEMFFALIFGLIVFKEMPATNEVIGGLFIMAAVVIPNIEWKKTK